MLGNSIEFELTLDVNCALGFVISLPCRCQLEVEAAGNQPVCHLLCFREPRSEYQILQINHLVERVQLRHTIGDLDIEPDVSAGVFPDAAALRCRFADSVAPDALAGEDALQHIGGDVPRSSEEAPPAKSQGSRLGLGVAAVLLAPASTERQQEVGMFCRHVVP